jgi:hypothetical protein
LRNGARIGEPGRLASLRDIASSRVCSFIFERPVDFRSREFYLEAGNSQCRTRKIELCTDLGEIHKLTRFLHLLPQIERT